MVYIRDGLIKIIYLTEKPGLSQSTSLAFFLKALTFEAKLYTHYCPSCGFRMYSKRVKNRTIKHPVLQDNYELILILRQRRWTCSNPECKQNISDTFKFVNKQRRTTNATDILIVSNGLSV